MQCTFICNIRWVTRIDSLHLDTGTKTTLISNYFTNVIYFFIFQRKFELKQTLPGKIYAKINFSNLNYSLFKQIKWAHISVGGEMNMKKKKIETRTWSTSKSNSVHCDERGFKMSSHTIRFFGLSHFFYCISIILLGHIYISTSLFMAIELLKATETVAEEMQRHSGRQKLRLEKVFKSRMCNIITSWSQQMNEQNENESTINIVCNFKLYLSNVHCAVRVPFGWFCWVFCNGSDTIAHF